MIDNSEKNFRQLIGKYIFNTFFKNNFDAYWVPGESSKNYYNHMVLKRVYLKVFIQLIGNYLILRKT